MTDYPCSWWRRTGRMTEFVRGISSPVYVNIDTNEERSSPELPVGALYVVDRVPSAGPNGYPPVGSDGLAVACVMLGHATVVREKISNTHWYIESRASNCTLPHDVEHRCWVRHGTIGEKLTVDKNGNTCAAGAGSFFMDGGRWHGFMQNGVLVQR